MKACIAILILISFPALLKASAENTDTVLVENAEVKITKLDFEAELQRIPERDRREFRASLDRISKLLTNLFINRSLAREAKEEKLDQDPVLRRRVQLYEEAQLAKMRMDRYLSDVEKPDFEGRAREVYLTEPDRFTSKPRVSASHILLTTGSRTEEEALQLALDLQTRIAGGESFDALVLEYSDDPSVDANKGSLGFFTSDQVVPPFAEAAFALAEVGDVSEPVLSQYGYHLIRLEAKEPAEIQPFDSLKDGLIIEMTREYLNQLRRDKMTAVYNSIKSADYDAILEEKAALTGPHEAVTAE